MSQSWLSRGRGRESGWNEPAFGHWASEGDPAPLPASSAPEQDAGLGWGAITALAVLAALAIGWIGVTIWSVVDPSAHAHIAPLIAEIEALSPPLVLSAALAILVLTLSAHWRHARLQPPMTAEDANDLAAQAAQSATRIAEAHAQLLNQTKAYAAAADRSASALLDAVNAISGRSQELADSTGASVTALAELAERMANFDTTAPQVEERLASLTTTLARLSAELGERGSQLETQLDDATSAAKEARRALVETSDSLGARLTSMRDGARTAGEELTALSELSSARIDLTLDRVKTVLDATEQRIEAQNSALAQMVERSKDGIETASRDALERFLAHCDAIEATLDALDERVADQSHKSGEWLDAAAKGVAMVSREFDALETSALSRTERLGMAMMELSGETRRLTEALDAGDQSSEQLVKRAEALLLALDSGIRELDESMPAAVGRVETRLAAMQQTIADATPGIEGVEAIAASLVSRMEDSGRAVSAHAAQLDDALARSQAALSAQKDQIDALAGAIVQASDDMMRLGDRVGPHMVAAMVRVRETAEAAAKRAHDAINAVIPQTAERLGEASSKAVEQAVTASITSQIERLNDVADEAVKTAHSAAESLSQRIAALAASGQALEQQVAGTREQIEAQDRELLTHHSAELIEMLNSRAIDVAKWLSHDISQTEWTAYLKGDQGIFARRAVKLLDRTDLRAIQSLYGDDSDFAEHLNRYVHDFEALLKNVLAARDGSALAVTLLSSDLGKLYVALAQAIDRLKAH